MIKSGILLKLIIILCILNSPIYMLESMSFDTDEFYALVVGDIGLSESESEIKKKVSESVAKRHSSKKFQAGFVLGDNVYPIGSRINDFERLDRVFEDSFPKSTYDMKFISILGNHEYIGDTLTQIEYSKQNPRFVMPHRFFLTNINLKDFNISFICVDSTPLIEPWMQKTFNVDDKVQKEKIEIFRQESQYSTFVVLISHHNIIPAFGPHTEYSGDNFLNNLITKSRFHLSLSAHNHNFQYVPNGAEYKTSYFTVGNGAKISKAKKNYIGDSGWHYDKSGGFATMLFNKEKLEFKFFDDDNEELKTVSISA